MLWTKLLVATNAYFLGTTLFAKIEGDGGGGDDGRIFPEHPRPILHAPRDNISRKDNPSLRYSRPIPEQNKTEIYRNFT